MGFDFKAWPYENLKLFSALIYLALIHFMNLALINFLALILRLSIQETTPLFSKLFCHKMRDAKISIERVRVVVCTVVPEWRIRRISPSDPEVRANLVRLGSYPCFRSGS